MARRWRKKVNLCRLLDGAGSVDFWTMKENRAKMPTMHVEIIQMQNAQNEK